MRHNMTKCRTHDDIAELEGLVLIEEHTSDFGKEEMTQDVREAGTVQTRSQRRRG